MVGDELHSGTTHQNDTLRLSESRSALADDVGVSTCVQVNVRISSDGEESLRNLLS